MTNWTEEIEGKFLSSSDLGPGIVKKVIARTDDIEYPAESGIVRHLIEFTEGKPLLLNKTNLRILINLAGGAKEFDRNELIGKELSLHKELVLFQGQQVPAIRIVDLS